MIGNRKASPEWVVFDLGGVLLRLGSLAVLWPDCPDDPKVLQRLEAQWVSSRVVRDYETGKLSGLSNFFRQARQEMGVTITEEAFGQVFLDMIIHPYPGTLERLEQLSRTCQLALLSNIGEDHWVNCQKVLGLDQYFKKTFLSFEMGVMKPDPSVYGDVVEKLDTDPGNILYFDDHPINVQAARIQGINAHICSGGINLKNKLAKTGLL